MYGRIDAGRRLLARSTGSVENVSKAIRSSVNASPSSFYGAVNIVDQDVESIIGGSASAIERRTPNLPSSFSMIQS